MNVGVVVTLLSLDVGPQWDETKTMVMAPHLKRQQTCSLVLRSGAAFWGHHESDDEEDYGLGVPR